MATQSYIKIRGARVHNLKNINVDIPKNKLVVITGLSGSGKSSLAFDTIYAEGQRRYVESLSSYARQFLGVMDKPEVDHIDGLSPAISIDQSAGGRTKNPRSTVGTITEIYDYLRLLFARAGKPHCPQCRRPVARQSVSQITDRILGLPAGTSLVILAPLVKDQKGEHKNVIQRMQDSGYARVRVDGDIYKTEDALKLKLEKYKRHSIEVVMDRLVLAPKLAKNEQFASAHKVDSDERSRIAESVEQALKLGDGLMVVSVFDELEGGSSYTDQLFSEELNCAYCGLSIPEIEPRTFSFNSPHGACPHCTGLGHTLEIDPESVFPNKNLTLAEGAVKPWASASHRVGRQSWYWYTLNDLAERYHFPLNKPVKELPKRIVDLILYGENSAKSKFEIRNSKFELPAEGGFEGIIPNLLRRYKETDSDFTRGEIERYMVGKICPICRGRRLRPEALAVEIVDKSIDWVVSLSIEECKKFFSDILNKKLVKGAAEKITRPIAKEILNRLEFLLDVGLEYLTLARSANSLSGGEAQRIRLATQIGSGLTGVLYILDEPSIGLHQRDQARLIKTLKNLRDLGNTVVVVEHDEQTINSADWVIDVGPGAGKHGGKIVFEGTPQQLKKSNSITGEYLSGRRTIKFPISPPKADPPRADNFQFSNKSEAQNPKPYTLNPSGCLTVAGAQEHNLKNITVDIPLGYFVAITGVSGSGKSSLMNDILAKYLMQKFYKAKDVPGKFKGIKGDEHLDKVVVVDQSPIGRTPRSNPATYTGLFGPIRELFSRTREAQVRGYDPGRFSFNVKGGRCEACEGQGLRQIEMHFLPDIYVECEECHASRYNREVLEIEYKGKNIAQLLKMSCEEALEFFKNIPVLKQKLGTLVQVGLSYIELGQPATTLSGGEAQRVKLATELSRRDTGRTLYILDEPTVGLHFDDVKKLLNVLHMLRNKGNTVLVIEHNLDVIKSSDYLIDLGPDGGEKGGQIVAQGTPEEVAKTTSSYTSQFLRAKFKKQGRYP